MKCEFAAAALVLALWTVSPAQAGSANVITDSRKLQATVVSSLNADWNYFDTQQVSDTSPQTASNSVAFNTGTIQYVVHAQEISDYAPSTPGIGNAFSAISFDADLVTSSSYSDAQSISRQATEFYDNNITFQVTQPTDWSWTGTFSSSVSGLGHEYGKLQLTNTTTQNDLLFTYLLQDTTGTDSTPLGGTLLPGIYELNVQLAAQENYDSLQSGAGSANISLTNGQFSFTALPEPAASSVILMLAGGFASRRSRRRDKRL
jgi:hypothetical protein